MSVKKFKFVSPGVFINEIDNSFVPKSAEAIGPVVIGRSTRGIAMEPTKVQSYSDFVEKFGDTVPGNGGGDIYRDGNLQSPMYGTYSAKAFLKANVAPLTYIRLLGREHTQADTDGQAGWKCLKTPSKVDVWHNGGAYGLFVWLSSSLTVGEADGGSAIGTGSLAAVFYANSGSLITLSGNVIDGTAGTDITGGLATAINSDSSNRLLAEINYATGPAASTNATTKQILFNFDDTSDDYIRNKFNTNPQLTAGPAGTFYPSSSYTGYWLGETFDQELRMMGVSANTSLIGAIYPIALSGAATTGLATMKQSFRNDTAGWFIGQDLGRAIDFNPQLSQKLFRLRGRNQGAWLHENCKVSIEKIRQSNSSATEYGTFSVVIRNLFDTDNNIEVMERFDNCTLDPASPNFIARKIGDMYHTWDTTSRRLKRYGEYANSSQLIYVEMNADVEVGATDATLLPFGYFAPPKFSDLEQVTGLMTDTAGNPMSASFLYMGDGAITGSNKGFSMIAGVEGLFATASFNFPPHRMRVSASDGGLSDLTNAYFGFSTTRTSTSTRSDKNVGFLGRLLYQDFPDDPTNGTIEGVDGFGAVFSMNDLSSSTNGYSYVSGSRANQTSAGSYTTILNAGYDQFTAPFWGGFDGLNIEVPDPFYNNGMTSATETTSYAYNTLKEAIDTVADPEFVNMNLLTTPGLTNTALTQHMINISQERADTMALIDLPNVYIPAHEQYESNKSDRIGTTPRNAAIALRNRAIDSSYGATFYPWVQTVDATTSQTVWIPPSVAMLGVLASSQAKSDVWFAPAGFNRGGLTDGAAGIPITNVTERVISKDRDILYEARINPIASFPSTGIVVFGQKTLQERQSALDRINVRRLVIYLKKQISILASQVLFEQNVQATWNRFKSMIEPFLANVKVQFGITDYKLILDESTTTPDLIDQNIMYAKIMIKPARAIEYIAIDFVVTSTGASFDD